MGPLSKSLTISLYPAHRETMLRRERELNIHRSVLFQLLLDLEAREGMLRTELIRRLTANKQQKPQPQKPILNTNTLTPTL